MITYVYAQDKRGAIGYNNDLPWYLPNDLKFFKKVTMGHSILMGRKTFESMNKRLLPGRKTIVMTSDVEYGQDIEGLKVVNSIDQVIKLANDQELMVIGGAGVFKSLFPYVDRIIRTVIDEEFEADTYMPELDTNQFELVQEQIGKIDEKNKYAHRFEWWERKKENGDSV
ncbi:dihydrofolate reductase [Facklamia sp. DSM 111018]|uniref:Dihydrofolate reductase n=1 Tax=Facklamia lactis TaxID=2749967 RepID=A0ABS0LMG9_9LACT|nr:dihydrofolate reductase [Facklamia lactis]MBG9979992.1 dihydrofolate reductase [Facklamia lactis]MBG9985328.1 dihydrofolate reductase [Facklamia lactis]